MKLFCTVENNEYQIQLADHPDGGYAVTVTGPKDGSADETLVIDYKEMGHGDVSMLIGRSSCMFSLDSNTGNNGTIDVTNGQDTFQVTVQDERERLAAEIFGESRMTGGSVVTSVMPGIVRDVRVAAGDEVAIGDSLLVLEAMKMENDIRSEIAGTVKRVAVEAGQTVASGEVLVELEPSE